MIMDPEYIDQQLNRLPENIGRFGRRFFYVDRIGDPQIQYTTKTVVFDIYSPSPDNDVLFVVSGKNLEEMVERTLATIETYTLGERGLELEPGVYIDPDLIDQGITNIGLIRPFGMISMMAPCVRLPKSFFHIFFLVKTTGYLLAFGRRGDHYFLRRNNSTVKLFFPPNSQATDQMAVAVTWSLEDISISGLAASPDEAGTKTRQIRISRDRKTDPTVPPNTLYTWARRQLLLPTIFYDRPGELFNVIMESLHGLNDEIARTDDIAGFWDEQRQGNKTIKRIPKREPTITKHVESRLRDITLQKNIDIHREIELGSSKLDLCFSAPLSHKETAKICVELKKFMQMISSMDL